MTKSRRKELIALYYPETICLDEAELKYFLLLYDRVFFLPVDNQLNPGHTSLSKRFSIRDAILTGLFRSREDTHYAQLYCSEPDVWDGKLRRLMDLYDQLEDRGIVVGLQDRQFAEATRPHPLEAAVDADLNDAEFLSACKASRNPKIFVPRIDEARMKGGGLVVRPFEQKGDRGLFGICSERLNTALYLAGRDQLFPVCGDPLYTRLLKAKLRRAIAAPPDYPAPPSSTHTFSLLSWEIATEVVPRNVILGRPAGDLLRYRAACADMKEKFREYLWTLETAVSALPWEEAFQKELDAIVNKEVVPEVRRIREQKLAIWEKVVGQTLSSACLKATPAIVGLQLVAGLTFWQILALGSSVLATAALQPLAEAWQEERKLRRNALFFLLRFRRG